MAQKGYNVEIRAHSKKPGVKNPEYFINGKTDDLKTPKSIKGIANLAKSAGRQKIHTIVLNLRKPDYKRADPEKNSVESSILPEIKA